MSLSTLNARAVTFLQEGRPDEGVSLLLEAFERLDLLTDQVVDENESQGESNASSASSSQKLYRGTRYSFESHYSKEASSGSTGEGSRYQEAVSRAMEAHMRLSQSRSIESNEPTNQRLDSVDSDVSDLSQTTGGEEGTEVVLVTSDPGEVGGAINARSEDSEEDAAAGISLQSIALPEFYESTPAEEETLPVSDNIFTFYQKAFVLTNNTTTTNLTTDDDEEESPKQSAVLLYNMAVAHHNYAMSSRFHDQVASHREFRTALVFYDMCFNIIQDSWMDDEDFLLLLLAVWNNMGHIHAHRYNYLETQEMLTSLQEILEVIASSPFMENPDFLFFYQNLVVYEEQEFAAAPAA